MYGLLQPIFPKWFELVLLRPFPMDLHHLWGGPFAVKKKALFSTQTSKKSVTFGTLPFFLLWSSKSLWKRSPSISRPLLSFPHIAALLSWGKWKIINGMVGKIYEYFYNKIFFLLKKIKKYISKYHGNNIEIIHWIFWKWLFQNKLIFLFLFFSLFATVVPPCASPMYFPITLIRWNHPFTSYVLFAYSASLRA